MKSFFGLIVLLLAIPLVSPAANRYVAPNGMGSACTQSTPCTLNTGLQQAVGGDTVHLLNGTYRQVAQTVRNGSASNRITIRALNRHQAILEWPLGNVFDQLSLQRHLTEMRPKTLLLGLFLLMMIAQISGIKWPHAT